MTRLGQMIYDDGKAEGRIEGKIEGRIEGKIEGKIEGETIKLVKLVCKKLVKDKTPEEIAYDLEEEPAEIKKICEAAAGYAPDYDYERIYEQIKNTDQ